MESLSTKETLVHSIVFDTRLCSSWNLCSQSQWNSVWQFWWWHRRNWVSWLNIPAIAYWKWRYIWHWWSFSLLQGCSLVWIWRGHHIKWPHSKSCFLPPQAQERQITDDLYAVHFYCKYIKMALSSSHWNVIFLWIGSWYRLICISGCSECIYWPAAKLHQLIDNTYQEYFALTHRQPWWQRHVCCLTAHLQNPSAQ